MKFLQPSTWFSRGASERTPAVAHRTGASLRPVQPTITAEMGSAIRTMNELAERLNRSYDGAMTDNYNSDFKGTYLSANGEQLGSRYKLRSRVRTLAKDTPHGKAIVRTFQNNTVGPDPFKLEMRVGKYDVDNNFVEEKETNRLIESAWNRFCQRKNFTVRKTWSFMEALRMVEAELITPGSVLCRLHRDYPFNEFGFAVDFLEEDRLQEGYSGKDEEGNPIRFSISWHPRYNFPLYYHILTRHPGEVFAGNDFHLGRDRHFRERVPAADIVHINNLRDRAEQDLGFTELDATTMPLWRIHQYEKSLTLSSIASAAKPFWIEKKLPNGLLIPDAYKEQMANDPGALASMYGAGTGDVSQSQAGNSMPAEAVRPGARETLPPGFELKQADPKFPIEGAHEFRQDNLRDIAIGTGISYQHASGDYQNLGFIAGLMCQIPFQDHVRVRQKNIADSIREIFQEWLKAWIKKDVNCPLDFQRVAEFVEAAHFKGKGFQHVNPIVQAQALIMLEEKGHLTKQQVQDALPEGMSMEKLIDARKNEKLDIEAAGLEYNPGAQAAPGDLEEEPESDEPKPAAKKKPQRPGVARGAGRIPAATMALIEHSSNGEH